MFKHVCCIPDVAPRLTSGGYEDKVDVIIYHNQHTVHKGVANFNMMMTMMR